MNYSSSDLLCKVLYFEKKSNIYIIACIVTTKTFDTTPDLLRDWEPAKLNTDTVIHSSHTGILEALDAKEEFAQLMAEHAEMIEDGKSSRDIIGFLWDKLSIDSWREKKFLGDFEFLPTPTESEMPRLQKYLSALGIQWSRANGRSDNHPEFFLVDGYIPEALVGPANIKKANDLLDTFHRDWQATRRDEKNKDQEYAKKENLLKKYLGLTEVDWNKLMGLRRADGTFEWGKWLSIYGSLSPDKKEALSLWITKDDKQGGSIIWPSPASHGWLFALAQVVPVRK